MIDPPQEPPGQAEDDEATALWEAYCDEVGLAYDAPSFDEWLDR